MARPRILVAESNGFAPRAVEVLRKAGDVYLADLDYPGLLEAARDSHVLWVRLRHWIGAEVLERAPMLRVLASATTGTTHIDLQSVDRAGVRLVTLRGETEFLKEVRATAECTIALMLALLRHLPSAAAHVLSGGWNRDLFRGGEVYGRTVAVVGYGRLGRIVAGYLMALGARVLAVDPAHEPASVENGVTLLPLVEALAQADVVTLHADHRPGTHEFFGETEFAAMKEGAYFVNTARGELVDEAALERALRSGRLAGAALDVLAGERSGGMAAHRLVQAAGAGLPLIITPHIGGGTLESMHKAEVFLAGKVAALMRQMDADDGAPWSGVRSNY